MKKHSYWRFRVHWYTLVSLIFIDVGKFTNLVIHVLKFVDIGTMYSQYTICNCMSYFYESLNLTKKINENWIFKMNWRNHSIWYSSVSYVYVITYMYMKETFNWFTNSNLCWMINISLIGFIKGMVWTAECVLILFLHCIDFKKAEWSSDLP